jgi:hypothetical protein
MSSDMHTKILIGSLASKAEIERGNKFGQLCSIQLCRERGLSIFVLYLRFKVRA